MDIYELLGFIIGDGNLYHNSKKRIYRLEMVGNVEEDFDYFENIEKFLFKHTGRKVIKFIRKEKKGQSIRIQFNNKKFVEEMISLGLSLGKKTFTVKIPERLIKDDEKMNSVLRGLFEADGCLYFSKSKKGDYPTYPRLEIRSSSFSLVKQVSAFLKKEEFTVYVKKCKNQETYGIYLSGEKMLEKWRDLIGFAGIKNNSKYNFWKTKGFYTPHTPLNKRITLCGDGTAATAVDSYLEK